MINKIKEFNDKNAAIYFLLAVIFLVVGLFFNRSDVNDNKENIIYEDEVENMKVSTNYTYDIKLDLNDNITLFTIKVFNNKYLITKTELGTEYIYFTHYSDKYIKSTDDIFIEYNGNFVNGIDNKLLFWNYINDIISKSDYMGNCMNNEDYNIKICSTSDGYNIENELYSISYKIYDVDSTDDFFIKK